MTSSKVLTLKYRPQTFDELLVQDHVRNTLKKAIEHRRFANAYLFAGPRGVGKTTTARILAKSLNCLSSDEPTVAPCNQCSACIEISQSRSMDVLEIDGASNRGIDQIRELRENIKYAPSSLRFKVYIIDEVHMLTDQAFNALLKTLEEPPAHAKFIFATTAAHKVPTTIISRCQRFDFRKATPKEITDRLSWVAAQEGFAVSKPALVAMARRADGAIRDGESILEQLATYRPEGIELTDVQELLGLVPSDLFFDYVELLVSAGPGRLLDFVARLFETGCDLAEFYAGLVRHFRAILLIQAGSSAEALGLLPEEEARLRDQASSIGRSQVLKALETLLDAEESTKYTQVPQVVFEYVSLDLSALLAAPSDSGPKHEKAGHSPPSGPAGNPGPRQEQTKVRVWQELILRVNVKRQMLASFMELAKPEAYENDCLTVLVGRHGPAKEKIEADKPLLEKLLSEVVGRPTSLEVRLSDKAAEPDPMADRIRNIFGEIEEETQR